jgi:hypothetical protein
MNQAITAAGGRRLIRNKAFVLQGRADDRKNRLLACLPDEDFDMLKSYLELVELPGVWSVGTSNLWTPS